MKRLAPPEVLAQAVAYAHQDLDRAATLWPDIAEQKRFGGWAATNLPLAERCDKEDCDGRPHGDWPYHHAARLDRLPSPESHSDPTGETVAAALPQPENADRRAQLVFLDALARLSHHAAGVEDAIKRVRRARVALAAQVPAVESALNAHEKDNRAGRGPDLSRPTIVEHTCRRCGGHQQVAGRPCGKCGGNGWTAWPDPDGPPSFKMTGRPGTSGVSLDDADRQRKGHVEEESACVVCELGVSQVGRLKAGMCKTDYDAWWRAGQPDRHAWILQRRAFLAERDGETAVVPLRRGNYRDDLKEVA